MDEGKSVLDILDELVHLPPDQQSGRLLDLGLSDENRSRIERWLKDGSDAAFLSESPDIVRRAMSLLHRPETLRPPSTAIFGPSESAARAGRLIESLEPPQIPGYQVVALLGRGGMGAVWRAVQTGTGRQVALKSMDPLLFTSPRARARFDRELRLAARLQHPNLARVYDGGSSAAGCYYAMELIEGQPLDEYVRTRGPSQNQVLDLMLLVCQGVRHAHQNGVIHRDLKPSNIMVDGSGQPRVLDFGLARAIDEAAVDPGVTMEGDLAGTPAYMSPEQASVSGALDTRTDVYSLGVILHELLTGRNPHDLIGPRSTVLRRIGEEEVRSPRRICRTIDPDLDALLLKALAHDRDRRYDSAAALAQDIANYLAGDPLSARPDGALYRARKWAWKYRGRLSTAAAVLSIMAGLIVYSFVRISHARDAAFIAQQAAESQAQAAERSAASERQQAREAQLNLAHGMATEGEALTFAGHHQAAIEKYEGARQMHAKLGVSTIPDDAGLLDAYRHAAPPLMRFKDHTGDVRCVALSPDERLGVTGSNDNTLIIWDLRSGVPLRHLRAHTGPVLGVAWSRDGRWIVSGGKDNTVRLWDASTGSLIRVFHGSTKEVWCVAFSPDASLVAAGGWDGIIRCWDTASSKLLWNCDRHIGVASVAFSRDGRFCVAKSGADLDKLDARSGMQLYSKASWSDGLCAPSPSADVFLLAHQSELFLCNLSDGSTIRKVGDCGWRVHVNAIAFCCDGRRTVSLAGGRAVLWDAQSATALQTLDLEKTDLAMTCSADGSWVFTGGRDGAAIWDLRPADDVLDLFPASYSVAMSPCGLLVATGGNGCFLDLWDIATGRRVYRRGPMHSEAISFSRDGRCLVVGGSDKWISRLAIESGRGLPPVGKHDYPITSLTFSADGRRLVSGTGTDQKVWEMGEQPRELAHFRLIRTISYSTGISRDGRLVPVVDQHGASGLFDIDANRFVSMLPEERGWGDVAAGRVAFFRDVRRFFGNTTSIQGFGIWDLVSGQLLRQLEGTSADLSSVILSPDDKWGLTGDDHGNFKLWDIEAAREAHSFSVGHNGVRSVAISPEGTVIATGTDDGNCLVWDLSRPARYRALQARVEKAPRLLEQRPQDPSDSRTLGEWYVFRRRWDWALEYLEQARRGGQDVSNLLMGRCYWMTGHLIAAQIEFRQAIQHEEAPAWYLRACLHSLRTSELDGEIQTALRWIEEGTRIDEAEAVVSAALAHDPYNPEYLLASAALLAREGDTDHALCAQETARFGADGRQECRVFDLRGDILWSTGQKDVAMRVWEGVARVRQDGCEDIVSSARTKLAAARAGRLPDRMPSVGPPASPLSHKLERTQ